MFSQKRSAVFTCVLLIAVAVAVACTDGDGNGEDGDRIAGPDANSSPTASISSPDDGSSFAFDQSVTLQGSGQDDEQGALDGAALSWRSDRDGDLGLGQRVWVPDLSAGVHTVSLIVEDSAGARDTASVGITVNQFQGAARPVYGVEPLRDALVTFDLTDGSMTSVGSLGSSGTYNYPAAMAARPSDQALFIWNKSDPQSTLSRVNRCTGRASSVYSSTALETDFYALAFAPDGTLYGLGPTLVEVNPDAGTHNEVGNITLGGSDMPRIGAAAFSPDGTLLAVERTDTDSVQRLVRIDRATGQATLIDTLSRDVGTVGSIALDADGRLWGSAYRNGEYDRDPVAFRLHAETAQVTDVRQLGSAAPTGMNFSPSCSSQPATGTLELQVATTGSAAHGYTAEISGPDADQTSVAPTDTVHFSFIETGDYQASLTDLPSSCAVTGTAGNPRTVTVRENDTTTTAFSVDCGTGSSKPSGTVVNAANNGGQASVSQSTWKGSASNMIDRDLGTKWSPAGNPDTIFASYTLSSEARIWGDSLDIDTGGSRDVTQYVLFARAESGGSWQQVQSVSDSISDATDGKGAHVFADTFNAVEVRLAITEHTAPELCYSSCDVPIVEYHLVGEFTTSGGNQAPTADLTFSPSSPSTGETVTFDASGSSDSDGSITEYRWDFDGDGTNEHTGQSATASHSYSNAGDYTAEVTVVDDDGATGSARNTVSVASQQGDLSVSTSTSGEDLDGNGYTVALSGASNHSSSIGLNDSVNFTGIAAGDYTVELTGLASNCSVDGSNPKSASVTDGASTSVSFSVTCSDVPGDLGVQTSTSGEQLDSDGYAVTLDGSTNKSIGLNDSVLFGDISSTTHTVELSGTAGNCSPTGANPRDVTVPPNDSTATAFSVSCLGVTTSSLTNAVMGRSYSESLQAAGGVSSEYSWSLVSGNLPSGLSLYSDGTLSGTPSEPGNFTFTVQVADSRRTAHATYTLEVKVGLEWIVDPQSGGSFTLVPYPTNAGSSGRDTYEPDTTVYYEAVPTDKSWEFERTLLDGTVHESSDYDRFLHGSITMDVSHEFTGEARRCTNTSNLNQSGYLTDWKLGGTTASFVGDECRRDPGVGVVPYHPWKPQTGPQPYAMMLTDGFEPLIELWDGNDNLVVGESPASSPFTDNRVASIENASDQGAGSYLLSYDLDNTTSTGSYDIGFTPCGSPAPEPGNSRSIDIGSSTSCRVLVNDFSFFSFIYQEETYGQWLFFPVAEDWSSWTGKDVRITVDTPSDFTGMMCIDQHPFADGSAIECDDEADGTDLVIELDWDQYINSYPRLFGLFVGGHPDGGNFQTGTLTIHVDKI